MIRIAITLGVLWQLAVILYQLWDPFRYRLARWQFYLSGLLPTWRMFSPEPADGDYLVFYRTAPEASAANARFTEWQMVNYDQKPALPIALFFNPHGNIVKALREICQQAVRSTSDRNVYYQLLLNDLIRRNRRGDSADPGNRLIQFQVRWQTPTSITPIFSSHVHPL